MNENWRYLYIALGAVTLMVAGLLVSYRWKMSRGVRPSESSLTLFDLKGQVSSFDSIAPLRSDSVEPDSALNKQLLLKQQKTLVRDMADEEGFRWQTELQQYRFREQAEAVLFCLEQDGEVVRDSLVTLLMDTASVFAQRVTPDDSLLLFFDERLASWQERLDTQTQLLPTALQALEAQQISDKEYSQIIKQVSSLQKRRR